MSGKGNAGAGGGYWSLWGRGGLSRFEGRPQTGLDLDDDLTADGALDNGTFDKGTLDTSPNSVYPYGYWSSRAGLGLWGLLGVGSGDATLTHRETDFATDLDMRMGALGLGLGLADGVMQRLRLELADELEMELFGGRNASENRSPEHLLGLTGRLRF